MEIRTKYGGRLQAPGPLQYLLARAVLFVCAMSQLSFSLQWGAGHPLWRLANAGLPFFVTFPVIVQAAGVIVVMPLSLWLGGVAATAPARSVSS